MMHSVSARHIIFFFFKGIQPTPKSEIKKRVAQHASIEQGTRKKKEKEMTGNTVYLT